MGKLVPGLTPPYYAVIFTSRRTEDDVEGYGEMADRMEELAARQEGYLGLETAHGDGINVTISYWATEEALRRWKQHLEHREAQDRGRSRWYAEYHVRVARVEREYGREGGTA